MSRLLNLSWFASLLLLLLVTACVSQKPAPEPLVREDIQTSPNDPRDYRYLRLENGMEVMLVSDPSTETSAASLAVGVGSYQNPEEFPGLAHYLEHMLFLGTENYPEPNNLQKFLEQNGGGGNAYTSSTLTNYMFQIPNEELDPALDRFSDYFKSPLFNKEYSEKEIAAVHNEWSMGRSQDGRIIHYLSGLTANPDHPASLLGVGNRETLQDHSDLSLYQAMLDFYQNYYSANIMNLTLVGGQSLDQLEALARKHFSGVPNRNIDRPELELAGLTEAQTEQHIYYQPQKELRQLILEFPLPDNLEAWPLKPNEYLATLIGSEEPGTLGHRLREWNLIDNLYAYADSDYYGGDGVYRIYLELTPKGFDERDRVVAAVFDYLELIRTQGIQKEHFEELKALNQRQFEVMDIPRPLQQAVHLSNAMFRLPVPYLMSAPYTYERFDAEEIREVAELLVPENLRLWHISKEVQASRNIPHHEGQYDLAPITQADRQRWRELAPEQGFELPGKNEFAQLGDPVIVEPTLTEMTQVMDTPGAEAWLMHAEYHQGEKGYFHLVFNSDLGLQSVEHFVLGSLLNGIYTEHNIGLIDRAGRASINVNIDRSAGNMQNLTISGPTGKHDVILKRLAESFVGLEFKQDEFDKELSNFQDWIEGRSKDLPYQQLFRYRENLIADIPWTDADILAASKAISAEDLQRYHRQLMRTASLRAYTFGNYRQEQIAEMVQEFEGRLGENRSPGEVHVVDYIEPEAGQELSLSKDIEHTDAALLDSFILPRPSKETQAQLLLLNGLFGNAFYTELRTQQQLGYVVGSSPFGIEEYPEFGLFVQSSSADLAEIKAAMDEFRLGYLDQLEAVDPNQVEQLKQSVIAQFTQKPNDFPTEATRYINDFYRNNTAFDTRDRVLAGLEAANKEDLVSLYRELLLGDDNARLLIQLRGTAFTDSDFISLE